MGHWVTQRPRSGNTAALGFFLGSTFFSNILDFFRGRRTRVGNFFFGGFSFVSLSLSSVSEVISSGI
ncbi:hypothetical protein PNOK_0416800 [Pyrrhoderma noxium]|uniref:Uncharacterized protein n=1 Tax=Pyrrhoderma noxium TaxID=2282107 RepID=A0A286UIF4_9AGAM|nr:hypothetical protein PNOK_0416800 [Pyrrhoderma noxium]